MFRTTNSSTAALPETGYLRLHQILGARAVSPEEAEHNRIEADRARAAGLRPTDRPRRPRAATPAVIPLSPSVWWEGVKSGRFPKPVKIGARATAWRVEDIRALLARLGQKG